MAKTILATVVVAGKGDDKIKASRRGIRHVRDRYEGHGRSKGARCYIKKFENIVNDCSDFFKSICAREEYRDKSRFLYGESMGGAVTLLLHKKDPSFWNGAVLVAPMCKISEKVKPHPVVVNILTKMEEIIPKWKIVPTKDVIDSAFKDPTKRELVRTLTVSDFFPDVSDMYFAVSVSGMCPTLIRNNKLIYQDKPRLKTALEMLRTSISLEDGLNAVTLPFFVLHGEADIVTDPEVSKTLYDKASSRDKTIKLFPGMWHGLTSGEPDANIEIVFADITAWLDKRCDAITFKQFLHPINDGFEKLDNTMTSMANSRMQSNGRYLCGLKQFRMQHHSAM
ncbi:Alpha/beta-Hydrolases superfamily protein isoform 2 [Hibiscus syriacus]|uniref:Alpha/beta-Hydrolases superfamily protein isoform 2 n=1 Tax=Hibiscus syriacus TaxID=106335 RepID=A0A6A2XQG0_HIBSY|nr:Alpha/beta-Hydrolases superfamily protein isoform 2 [Hibiscus syriacus]